MGCHTWFYKEYDLGLSDDQIREKVIKHFMECISVCEEVLPEFDGTSDTVEGFKEEDLIKEVEYSSRVIRVIKQGYCMEAVKSRLAAISNYSLHYSRKQKRFYTDADGFHDLFRVSNYPNEELTSFNEVMNFSMRNSSFRPSFENWKEELKRFFELHPNGLIDFG